MTEKKPDLEKASQTAKRSSRDIILERRNRFIAAALAGTGLANAGCDDFGESGASFGGSTTSPPMEIPDNVSVCLSIVGPDPQVCLTPPFDPNPPISKIPTTDPLPSADPVFPDVDGGLASDGGAQDAGATDARATDASVTDASADAGMGAPDADAALQDEPQDSGA